MIIHVRAFANFRDILGKDLKLELRTNPRSRIFLIAFVRPIRG